jgi:hypothetical protein
MWCCMKENKLQLRRETLRQLSSDVLEEVNGGTAFSVLTRVPTNVWAGLGGAVAGGARWANNHLPARNPRAGYKPYG